MSPRGSTKNTRATTIDVVEAMYENLGTEPLVEWFERITERIASCIGEGLGAVAHTYKLGGPPSGWTISAPFVFEAPAELGEVVRESFSQTPPDLMAQYYRNVGPTGTFSELTGMDLRDLPSGADGAAVRFGIIDQIYVHASNPDDRGMLITVNVPERRRLVPAERSRLSMIAAHVAAASRLLPSLEKVRSPAAIFDPTTGKIAHVEKGHVVSRPSLRERAVAIDRARARARSEDADRALETWKALLDGKYTLLDRFESDGRRFVVAYENEPAVEDPRRLTKMEAVVAHWATRGHSDKLIAYELGIAPGTVAALVSRVLRKVGGRSRVELGSLLAAPSREERVPLEDGGDLIVLSSAPEAPIGSAAFEKLTGAERRTALAVARGLRNDEIAEERKVSASTVANQLTSIYRKLGVRSRAELVALRGPRRSSRPPARGSSR